jgi:predicted acetyltransferase
MQLTRPDVRYRDSFLAGLREFQAEGLRWHVAVDADAVAADFDGFVARQLAKETRRTEVLVPETELWGIVGGEYVGRIAIRHELTPALRQMGGHVGYDTRPPFRHQGIATKMLGLALPWAWRLGLPAVMLTVSDGNAASIRVIEKNGGVLEKTIPYEGTLKRHYWIRR